MSEARFTRIDERLDGMATRMDTIQADISELQTDVSALKVGQVDLGVQMRVLYEDTKQTLKVLQEGQDDMPRQFRLAVAEAIADVNQRVTPIEASERFHTRVLDDHERRITDLESRSDR